VDDEHSLPEQEKPKGRERRKQTKTPLPPFRHTIRRAAEMLSISPKTLYQEVSAEMFTVIAPDGRGMGKRIYLYHDEVEVFAFRGRAGLLAFRLEKRRISRNDYARQIIMA
jgi:hypothetical protein